MLPSKVCIIFLSSIRALGKEGRLLTSSLALSNSSNLYSLQQLLTPWHLTMLRSVEETDCDNVTEIRGREQRTPHRSPGSRGMKPDSNTSRVSLPRHPEPGSDESVRREWSDQVCSMKLRSWENKLIKIEVRECVISSLIGFVYG